MEALDLVPTVSTLEEATAWNAAFTGRRKVFLKVDVGLLRAGAMVADLPSIFAALGGLERLELAGIYGHFFSYGASVTADQVLAWQFARMAMALRAAADAGVGVPSAVVSSTNAVLDHPEMDLTGVDPGRLLYGLSGSERPARQGSFRPALVGFKTRLVLRKDLGEIDADAYAAPFVPRPGMRSGCCRSAGATGCRGRCRWARRCWCAAGAPRSSARSISSTRGST